MLRLSFSLVFASVILLTSEGVESAEPQIGRCHMGGCSWSSVLDKKIVEKRKGAVLIRLELIGGYSQHDNVEDYPSRYSSDVSIEWNTKSHTVFVACDVKRPLVVIGNQIDLLDLHDVPGVLEGAATLWVQTCYNSTDGNWIKVRERARIPKPEVLELTPSQEGVILGWISQYY